MDRKLEIAQENKKEKCRIAAELKNIRRLADLCPSAVPSVFTIAEDNRSIIFNGVTLPLYNQRIGSTNNYYFFHEIELKYIENDDKIQLRPIDFNKALSLALHLMERVQLAPSVARLDQHTRTVKLMDGQHKAVAQIIGNRRDSIPLVVFLSNNVDDLLRTVYEAHTAFAQSVKRGFVQKIWYAFGFEKRSAQM